MHHAKRVKKSFGKRLLAASLAVLMACPALPVVRSEAAKAAKPYVSLRTAFKTLKVGQKNKMTLKNNTIGWKITKVATNDRTIAMVYGKTASGFMIKGKSAGRTTVRAKLKTDARKKSNQHSVKTVRCRVNVIQPQEDAQQVTEAEVSTQAELEKALSAASLVSLKKLTIRTKDAAKLTIPAGTYSGVALMVDAPACDIENGGVFQSITIQAIKPDTWVEKAVGNVMNVLASAARIIVNQGARLEKLALSGKDAKIKLEVNGKIDEVSVSAKLELSISGKPEAPINTTIEASAAGTVLVSEAPVNITAHASVDITLNKGAENSTVDIRSKDAQVKVNNYTNSTITVKKADGTVEKKGIQINTSSGSYYRPSVSTPSVSTGPAITPTGPSIDVTDPPFGDSGIGGGGIGGGGFPGGGSGNYYNAPSFASCRNVFQPEVQITVTRSAIEGNPVTTMSAVLVCDIKPEKANIGTYPGYAQYWFTGVEYSEATSHAAVARIDVPEVVFEDISGSYSTTVKAWLQFVYTSEEFKEKFDYPIQFVIYDKQALEQFLSCEEGWIGNQMYIKVPISVLYEDERGEDLGSYEFDPSCICKGPFTDESEGL